MKYVLTFDTTKTSNPEWENKIDNPLIDEAIPVVVWLPEDEIRAHASASKHFGLPIDVGAFTNLTSLELQAATRFNAAVIDAATELADVTPLEVGQEVMIPAKQSADGEAFTATIRRIHKGMVSHDWIKTSDNRMHNHICNTEVLIGFSRPDGSIVGPPDSDS